MRYEKRGERPPWPGLEAWRRHPQRQLRAWTAVGLQRPTAPSFLRLLDFPSLSAPVCLAFRFAAALCFGFFLLLFLSFALLFGWQPPAEPMFTERPTRAHCTARGPTHLTRVHVPPTTGGLW